MLYVYADAKEGNTGILVLEGNRSFVHAQHFESPEKVHTDVLEAEALLHAYDYLIRSDVDEASLFTDCSNLFSALFLFTKQPATPRCQVLLEQVRLYIAKYPQFKLGLISRKRNLAHFVCRGEDYRLFFERDVFKMRSVSSFALKQYREFFGEKHTAEEIAVRLNRNIAVAISHKNYYMYGNTLIFVEGGVISKLGISKQSVRINEGRKEILSTFLQMI
jgi:hypothetical protein